MGLYSVFNRLKVNKLSEHQAHDCTISVGAEATDVVTVTFQMKDGLGRNLSRATLVRVWLSDTAGGAKTATAPSGAVSATVGTVIDSLTAKTHLLVKTNASGAFTIEATEAGALTKYWNVEIAGKIISSAVLTWT